MTNYRALIIVGALAAVSCSDALGDADGGLGDGGADGGDGATGGGDGDTGRVADVIGDDKDCGMSPFAAAVVRANILVVLDRSGSMVDSAGGFDGQSKWAATSSALAASLDSVKDDVYLGLQLFPSADALTIDVPVEAGADALPKIEAALKVIDDDESLLSAVEGTPTQAALKVAHEYFTTGAGENLEGEKYVLLATDGGPNSNEMLAQCDASGCTINLDGECNIMGVDNCCQGFVGGCLDADGTAAQIEALASAGIETFVVGIPGSEAYADVLDDFATKGGRANSGSGRKYFEVTSAGSGVGGLASVLSSITASVITSCALQLQSVPPDPGLLNVDVDGELIAPGPNGWELDESTDPATVILLGETCDKVESDGVDAVTVVYGCPVLVE